jgi:TRAP-type C4-dicarboxylate transport system substrate-binding protein
LNKKLLLIPLALILALSLVAIGCPTTTPTTTAPPTTTTPPTTTAPPPQPIVFIYGSVSSPADMYQAELLIPYFEEIEKQTGGRVKIEQHYNATLAGVEDTFDAVVKGTMDMGHSLQGFCGGMFPMEEILAFHSYDVTCYRTTRLLWDLYQEFPEMQAEYEGTKVLWLGNHFQTYMWTANNPIRNLEDLQGLKMMCAGLWTGNRMAGLGGVPMMVPPPGFEELEKGVLDGGVYGMNALWDLGLGEVIQYHTDIHCGGTPMFLVMNLDKWNSLPADIQQIIENLSGPALADTLDEVLWYHDVADRQGIVDDFGIETITLSPEELARWAEADGPAAEAFIAELDGMGLPGQRLWDEYHRLELKYAAEEYAFD